MFAEPSNHGVARFVIRNALPFSLLHRFALFLHSTHHTIRSVHYILQPHFVHAATHRLQRRFVHDVADIRACIPGRQLRDLLRQHLTIIVEFHAFQIDLRDVASTLQIRLLHIDMSIKSPGAKQRGIQNVHAVRASEHHDVIRRFKPVHLH